MKLLCSSNDSSRMALSSIPLANSFTESGRGPNRSIRPCSKIDPIIWTVESDWSSASYFYSIVAMAQESEISLNSYFEESRQGDAALAQLYEKFGISTSFTNKQIKLSKKEGFSLPNYVSIDLKNTPDLAQPLRLPV